MPQEEKQEMKTQEQEKKYSFRYDLNDNGAKSETKILTVKDVMNNIKTPKNYGNPDYNSHYHELINGPCMPYIDIDRVYEKEPTDIDELITDIYNTIYKFFTYVSGVYGFNDVCPKLFVSNASGMKPDGTFKLSLHMTIRNVGHYKNPREFKNAWVNQINDELNDALIDYPNTQDILDMSCYGVGPTGQCMRIIGCKKLGDKSKRTLLPTKHTEPLTKCVEYGPKYFEYYLITNTAGEYFVKCEERHVYNNIEFNGTLEIENLPTGVSSLLNEMFLKIHPHASYDKATTVKDISNLLILEFKNSALDDCLICKRTHGKKNQGGNRATIQIYFEGDYITAYYFCFSENARERMYSNKPKSGLKPMTITADELDMMQSIGHAETKAVKLVEKKEKNIICKKDEYVWLDFYNQYANKTFDSIDAIEKTFYDDLNRVFASVQFRQGSYIKKDNTTNSLYNTISTELKSSTNFDMYYSLIYSKTNKKRTITETRDESISFSRMIKNIDKMNVYSEIICEPDDKLVDKKAFNIWTGFKAKPVENVDMNLINPMLNLYFEVWCAEDEKLFEYLMNWFAFMVQKPADKPGDGGCIFLCSKPGTGKSTGLGFLSEYILGDSYHDVDVVEQLVEKHDTLKCGKRLLTINEMASTREEFQANFNKLKGMIDGKKHHINPKGVQSYDVKNFSMFIFTSNYKDSLHLDQADRRYACLEASKKYCNNKEYFANIRKNCFNQTTGDHFYTYLINRDINGFEKSQPPMTQMKQDILLISAPSYIKYLRDLKERLADYVVELKDATDAKTLEELPMFPLNIDECKAGDLYANYTAWCKENGERMTVSSTKFGTMIKNQITSKRSNGIKYDLKTITFD